MNSDFDATAALRSRESTVDRFNPYVEPHRSYCNVVDAPKLKQRSHQLVFIGPFVAIPSTLKSRIHGANLEQELA